MVGEAALYDSTCMVTDIKGQATEKAKPCRCMVYVWLMYGWCAETIRQVDDEAGIKGYRQGERQRELTN